MKKYLILIIILLINPLVHTLSSSASTLAMDKRNDVVFKIYGIIQSVGDYHDELDILDIKVNETHVVMTLEDAPKSEDRIYHVRIYWDDDVENGAWGYNKTECMLFQNYTYIQLFNDNNEVIFEEPVDIGIAHVNDNIVNWKINTSMLSPYREPIKIYGFCQFQEVIQIYPEILSDESWTDYYPNDQYRYINYRQFYWLFLAAPLLVIPIIFLKKGKTFNKN